MHEVSPAVTSGTPDISSNNRTNTGAPAQPPSPTATQVAPMPAATPAAPIHAASSSGQPSAAEGIRVTLTHVSGASFSLRLQPGVPVTIGRGEAADITIPGDSAMSRLHVRLELGAGGVILHDLGSANGVQIRVDGSVALRPGMHAILGETVLALKEEPSP